MYCFIQYVLFYTKCIVLYNMYCFIQNVLFYTICIVLYNMYCFIQNVLFYTKCTKCIVLYKMYCFIQNVLFYTKCIVLYKMYCFRSYKVLEVYRPGPQHDVWRTPVRGRTCQPDRPGTIRSVLFHTKCIVLYKMYCFIQNVLFQTP